MKSFLILVVTIFVLNTSTKAQYVSIPDPVFKEYLMEYYPSCFNNSEMLDTTCLSLVNETTFTSWFTVSGIVNWDGFQYFKNLQVADFSVFNCTSLPTLPNTLKKLIVLSAAVTTLPIIPNGLTYLDCRYIHGLTTLPTLPNSLQYLDCSDDNPLLTLPAVLPASLKYLNCKNINFLSSIPALPGSLDTLICSNNSLSSLPVFPATLKYLECSNNSITVMPALPAGLKTLRATNNLINSIPALPAGLEQLYINSNQLTSLPVLPSSLILLGVAHNGLSVLPTLPASMENLDCSYNQISNLPALPNGLKTFNGASNLLTLLPATLPAGLTDFSCSQNSISTMPALPVTLTSFSCDLNLLTNLPLLPPNLAYLYCGGNQLTSLPPLPATLNTLFCAPNHIYFLPALPPHLEFLFCYGNNITCMPVLPVIAPADILQIVMDDEINCIPNAPAGVWLDVHDTNQFTVFSGQANNYPLCSAVNNINHCDAFPLMTGYAYNDNNNNMIRDANEPYRANVKVELSNGAFTMTNSNGYYQIPADSIGNYTITVTPPNYFTSVPLQYNYNFGSYDTLVTNDFALQATSSVDSLTISVLPVNWAARPGFAFPYLISYQNAGTTTLSPNIVFNYDNSRLIYDSSSNAAVINSGSALSLAETGLVAGDQKAFVGYFRVNPAAVIGDSIRAYVSIHANAITAVDSTITGIRGAYDPNDKSATPKLTPSQVTNGNYIYYTIRFQNTGTDTAFSVVITDTLNSQLQGNTLEVINTSHPAKITVKGNIVYFEFINILLPDSNVNEMKSHGYVSFRIKPQPTVVLNSTIPNKAAIYFDYNSPVITNTAVTTISNAQTVPLKLISFKVIRSIASNANAYWNTSDEINVLSYNIEMSLDGKNFNTIAYEKAKGYQYNDYTKTISIPNNDILYFRLKMTDVDGRFTYSPIVTLRNDQSNSFSFLNNPVKDELNISIQDDALKNTNAKIYNVQGVLIKTILLQRDIETVDIRSLPAGTYYLVTEVGSGKFIVLK